MKNNDDDDDGDNGEDPNVKPILFFFNFASF